MRTRVLVAFCLLGGVPVAAMADEPMDFSGEWVIARADPATNGGSSEHHGGDRSGAGGGGHGMGGGQGGGSGTSGARGGMGGGGRHHSNGSAPDTSASAGSRCRR